MGNKNFIKSRPVVASCVPCKVYRFNMNQFFQIGMGIKHGLTIAQVRAYAKPEFNSSQMFQIKEGFEKGLTMEQVSIYAKPEFSHVKMETICNCFRKGLTIEDVEPLLTMEYDKMELYIKNKFRIRV